MSLPQASSGPSMYASVVLARRPGPEYPYLPGLGFLIGRIGVAASLGCGPMAKKGTSGGGTVRTRKDGLKEARLLVPKEYRAAVGRTYLYFYGKTEKEAKRKRTAAERDMIRRGPQIGRHTSELQSR